MSLVDLIFPKECLECKKVESYICENCLIKVRSGGWIAKDSLAIFRYEGVVRKAILALKYKFSTVIAKELASVCVRKLTNIDFELPANPYLVPVPLYWKRKNWRGFNQSELLGRLIAEQMKWKFIPDLLMRTENKVPQVQLDMNSRKTNVVGVFSLNQKRSNLEIPTTIVLFDDVWTTGSTMKEAVKTLKKNGVKEVLELTVAR